MKFPVARARVCRPVAACGSAAPWAGLLAMVWASAWSAQAQPVAPVVPVSPVGVAPVTGTEPVMEPVVVTATRTPERASAVLADVSVIGHEEIARSGALGVADLLARLPGVAMARNGGPGTSTSLYIRGGESRHTAVYVDGVRVDSQSTGGALWEQIPLAQIERIEVLRGPAAAVYGSDAIAGVVQVFTRRGQGGLQPTASIGLGSQGTKLLQAGLSGAHGAWDHALSVSHGRSAGFGARTLATANPDRDGWRRGSVQARVGWRWQPGQRIEASVLGTRLHAQYDGSLAQDDWADHGLRTASLAWQGQWSAQASSTVQLSESRSSYETRPSFYRTETTLRNLLVQHEQPWGAHRLSVLLERREDALHNPASNPARSLRGERAQNGLALGWQTTLGARSEHALQLRLRHEDDSAFGGQSTGSLAWGWQLAPQWRSTVSAATAFRAPTLYQRYSEYGVAGLVPETARHVELGLRWARPGQQLAVNAWRNQVVNLINFGAAGPCASSFGCYENVGRARYQGVTVSGQSRLGPVLLRAALDRHDPRNLDTDKLLARRARVQATLGAQAQWAGWSVGADVQASGARFDNAANTQRLGGYGLLNLHASTPLGPGLLLDLRLDNVGDKAYQLARTYNTAGRTGLLSLRWTPR